MHMTHAPTGGTDLFGHHYRGGEFLPFYVPRERMPQVDEVAYPDLVAAAHGGPGLHFAPVQVHELRAHQRIDHRRAQTMPDEIKVKPVIVSADGYVVDGNHRWWAHVHAGDRTIYAIHLHLPFEHAIEWVKGLPFAYEITPTTPERN